MLGGTLDLLLRLRTRLLGGELLALTCLLFFFFFFAAFELLLLLLSRFLLVLLALLCLLLLLLLWDLEDWEDELECGLFRSRSDAGEVCLSLR